MENHAHRHEHQGGKAFALPFFLILIFAILELLGGVWTNSLALLGDAWHMFSDVFALGLAWFAAHHAASSKKHASGQSHLEIAASIINAILMVAVVIYIIYEAIHRLKNPHAVTGGYVILIAFAGLIVNIVVAKLLHHEDENDHNRRAAYLHVLGDLLGSVGALLAGAVIYFTGYIKIDPLLSIFIALLILFGTLALARDIWQSLKHEGK